MAKNVKFNRLKNKAFATGSSKDADTIYFTTDTREVILGGQVYGGSSYTAGTNIGISGGAISALGYVYNSDTGSFKENDSSYGAELETVDFHVTSVSNGTASGWFDWTTLMCADTQPHRTLGFNYNGSDREFDTLQVIVLGMQVRYNFTCSSSIFGSTGTYECEVYRDYGAFGDYSHAEGENTGAYGSRSHAEGDYAEAVGSYSHAEGSETHAYGSCSHAENDDTLAIGEDSHAEGEGTTALGDYSHTEGQGSRTLAPGTFSWSTGSATITWDESESSHGLQVGYYVFFGSECRRIISISGENNRNITLNSSFGNAQSDAKIWKLSGVALGYAAHSEGEQTIALGEASHAGGYGTIADIDYMTAIGKYNLANGSPMIDGDTLFVVGGGTGDNARKNMFIVTTNGVAASLLNLSSGNGLGDNYGGKLSFGDGDLAYMQEDYDDHLKVFSNEGITIESGGSSTDQGGDGTITLKTNNDKDINILPGAELYVSSVVRATGGFYQTSDIRKKNVLSELDLDKAYDLIDKCQTILYTLKDDKSDKKHIGMIAQEVQQFFPELITEDKDGYLSLDYAKLTVIILKVLKDLISRISKLENKQ